MNSLKNRYFRARYVTADGKDMRQSFFVPSQKDVRREVAQLGGVIQAITEHRPSWLNHEYYSREYKIGFLKGLAFHIDVGTSAGQALIYLIESEQHAAKRAEMQPVLEVLAQGGRFGDAITMLPFMDKSIVTLMQAADQAGTVNEAIADAIAVIESQNSTWKMMLGTFSWIGFDLFSMVSAVLGVQFGALPWFRNHMPPMQDTAKAAEYAQRIDTVALANTWLTVATIALVIAAIVFFGTLFLGSPATKDRFYKLIMRFPLLRSMFTDGELSSGMLLLSRMSKSGVPLMHGLELLANSSTIFVVSQFWRRVQQSLNAGWDTTRALASGSLLTRQELIVLGSHQNREQLAKVLESIASQRRQDAEYGAKRFVRLSVWGSIVYMLLVMGVMVWLVSLQDMGLSGSFEDLLKGGF